MAVFLLKTKNGSTYDAAGVHGDLRGRTCPSQFADWIEQLAAEQITGGCGGGNYCPEQPEHARADGRFSREDVRPRALRPVRPRRGRAAVHRPLRSTTLDLGADPELALIGIPRIDKAAFVSVTISGDSYGQSISDAGIRLRAPARLHATALPAQTPALGPEFQVNVYTERTAGVAGRCGRRCRELHRGLERSRDPTTRFGVYIRRRFDRFRGHRLGPDVPIDTGLGAKAGMSRRHRGRRVRRCLAGLQVRIEVGRSTPGGSTAPAAHRARRFWSTRM